MKHISVQALQEVLKIEGSNPSVDFINVCTSGEYAIEHIAGVRSVPLDELEKHIDEFRDKKSIYVHCRSGGRSQLAISMLGSLGIQAELINVEGGIMAWQAAGLKTNKRNS